MFSNLNNNCRKRGLQNIDNEPPDKKLISDADIFVKQLSQKQQYTKISLEETLNAKSSFYKASEIESITKYTSGISSLEKFNAVLQQSDSIEWFKSAGLSQNDVELYMDYTKGEQYMAKEHKNINKEVLEARIKKIEELTKNMEQTKESEIKPNCSRLTFESISCMKPTSIETKLFKFALCNSQTNCERLPHPMDNIKQIESDFSQDLSSDVKQILDESRKLRKEVEALAVDSPKAEPVCMPKKETFSYSSKWDLKEKTPEHQPPVYERKLFTCKPLNYYTVKDGHIVKLNSKLQPIDIEINKQKLTIDEIKRIPKFENYDTGHKSKKLYIKNLAKGVKITDLQEMLGQMSEEVEQFKILNGKMRGQAFIDVKNEEAAEHILLTFNGTFIKNKPVIIQYGKLKK